MLTKASVLTGKEQDCYKTEKGLVLSLGPSQFVQGLVASQDAEVGKSWQIQTPKF